MSQPTLTGSGSINLLASPAPTSEVPVGDLELIVGVSSARFPGHTSAHVRDVVYETHRRLSAEARIHAHLIPLTLNLSRSQLNKRLPCPVSTRP
jgi:hypothetical protein